LRAQRVSIFGRNIGGSELQQNGLKCAQHARQIVRIIVLGGLHEQSVLLHDLQGQQCTFFGRAAG
jgi:hypothetical protein